MIPNLFLHFIRTYGMNKQGLTKWNKFTTAKCEGSSHQIDVAFLQFSCKSNSPVKIFIPERPSVGIYERNETLRRGLAIIREIGYL